MKELKINYLAVLVAFVLQFAIGFLWYGPLFGDPWMNMVGLDMDSMNGAAAGPWITNIVASAATMLMLAWILTRVNGDTLLKGACYGFFLGFTLTLLPVMRDNMFAGFPYGLAWITAGFTVTGLTLGGALLGAWKKYRA